MDTHAYLVLAVLFLFCNGAKVRQDTINGDLVLSKVERKIDITAHIVKVHSVVTVENGGSSSAGFFLVALDPSLQNYISYVGATVKGEGDKETPLAVSQATVDGHGDKKFWRVQLPMALLTGKSIAVAVEAVYTHALQPFPTEIVQGEKQFVVFLGNLYFYSPYKTTTQTTIVKTFSSNIESYTKTKPVSQSDNTISFGPYENQAPFSEAELKVHCENNSPFLTVTSLERIIEVSHWGNIAVEEHVEMRHSGALLKGPFSRYDYQRTQDSSGSIKSFKTILPATARDIYYRDEIGNISTSHLRETDELVEVELRPRFPLFGGWKTKYYIGYNVPSYQYLFNKGDDFLLKLRFVDHIYDDMVVDQMTVKVILPEGSKNFELKTPYDVVRNKDQVHFTYLDTTGRPVIVLYKSNLVEQHIQDFELHYTFHQLLLLQEPLLVVGAFYLLFVLVIIYVRLDFSITKDEVKESKMRVASLVEEVQNAQDRRSALYQSYDDAINKFKANKEAGALAAARKKIDGDYKQLTTQIQGIQAQLKVEGSDAAEKVAEVNKLDRDYKELINLAIGLAEKLVAGKLSKPQYIESEQANSTKREEIVKKMEDICAGL
ncbi:hypothetical protein ACJMK2_016639 [Sinanodonta woodiana]|uniref:Dolichyl-diphosphooligosaccharide--protein glycosyltransferase subunit 1 n=1 Tax=Sinanodonta woodiana TaxID=1069815 RepID=A0ABD3UXT5_SINWO